MNHFESLLETMIEESDKSFFEKEPWEMTRNEHTLLAQPENMDPKFRYSVPYEGTHFFANRKSAIKWLDIEHKRQIKWALSENKPVPPEVLNDYKDEPWAQEALKKYNK